MHFVGLGENRRGERALEAARNSHREAAAERKQQKSGNVSDVARAKHARAANARARPGPSTGREAPLPIPRPGRKSGSVLPGPGQAGPASDAHHALAQQHTAHRQGHTRTLAHCSSAAQRRIPAHTQTTHSQGLGPLLPARLLPREEFGPEAWGRRQHPSPIVHHLPMTCRSALVVFFPRLGAPVQ